MRLEARLRTEGGLYAVKTLDKEWRVLYKKHKRFASAHMKTLYKPGLLCLRSEDL